MTHQKVSVQVNPEVFKWLRESSSWTIEEVARRLRTSPANIQKVESGERQLTIRQLRELSRAFKRPIAAFLLLTPKKERPKPKDYRMIPEKTNKFDKKTILVLRKARYLQELSNELSRNINYNTKYQLEPSKLSDNSIELALKYRQKFMLTEEKQTKFKTPYELFNYLRDLLENLNILVFQYSMPVEDARGFALVDENPAVIVVNTKDSIEARLFSLMHEVAHVLLGESVIDLPDVNLVTRNSIEKWCNNFSASFLLPTRLAKEVFEKNKSTLTQKNTLNSFARRYKVSKSMLLLAMFKLDYITQAEYNSILARFTPSETIKKKISQIPSEKKRLSEVGNKFVSLVANNYDKGYITYSDALNYLSVKTKKFDKIVSKAKK